MAGALNIFKTVRVNLTTTMTPIYTPPLGYATVVLMAQVSNITDSTITISANVSNATSSTALVRNALCPTGDSITVLTGRLVLTFGENFEIKSADPSCGQLTLSLLESLAG
jgi:hypothetical protein